jgi:hypothetical protein
MIDAAGGEQNMEGYIGWGLAGLEETKWFTPAMSDWKTRYLSKFGEYDPTSIDWSMGAYTLADGVQAANSLEPEAIAAALQAPSFVGQNLWGAYSYGGEELFGGIGNEILAPIAFYQWQDGKARTIVVSTPEEYMPIAIDMGMAGMYR